MRTIADMLTIPPSTSLALTIQQLEQLSSGSVVHWREGVCQLRHSGGDDCSIHLWNHAKLEFRDTPMSENGLSAREIVTIGDVHWLRLPRLVCASTAEQVRNRTKTVTRRVTAPGIDSGALLNFVDGARRIGTMVMGTVEVESIRREMLTDITDEDLALEGFPDMSCPEFIQMFRNMHGFVFLEQPEVYRIAVRYL